MIELAPERIADAAGRSGRSPDDVRLIAVSKTHPIDAVRAAADAGQRDFGENKVQEALQKIGVAQVLSGGAVQPLRQDTGCLVQADVVEQRLQAAG